MEPTPPSADAPNTSDPDLYTSHLELGSVRTAVDALREEIGRLVVGQAAMIDELIACLLAGGHALIEGVPGVAKTLTAKLLAKASGLEYSRVQFTPDLMPADVLGTSVFRPQQGDFEFHPGPVFAQIVLIDEINRAPAKTQAALFEVMEERQATVDGTRYPMAAPFMVVATQNPVEHEGTYNLPEAQLDRFLFKVVVGYPSLDEEVTMLERFQSHGGFLDLDRVHSVLDASTVEDAQRAVRSVRAEAAVLRYAAEIVGATRAHPALALGASPRATLALVRGAKAVAAMSGRDFATPDDLRAIVAPALRHRILLTPEREIEGVRPEGVLRRIVEEVEVPR
ncbi:MAG TPA: MoxR family ATPase [Bacteroidetes bacterium]|nr:MoxR family ATPase [Bacteroidota bacterium]HIL58926.1 MoxR family ATPase [Rhodothermales bacterium]